MIRKAFINSLLAVCLMVINSSFGQNNSTYFARIAVLRPHDGKTTDFESGYIRHLEWHRQAGDKLTWYGWTLWASERQRWFVYATFGLVTAALDNPVSPAEDEKDNVLNVVPHCEFVENGLYEFLPGISSGSDMGVPKPEPRVQMITVELSAGDAPAFEKALASNAKPAGDVLWYKRIAGGVLHRYVCLRSKPVLSEALAAKVEQALPETAAKLARKVTVEILVLRPQMSYGINQAGTK